jgi:hypothetical protein
VAIVKPNFKPLREAIANELITNSISCKGSFSIHFAIHVIHFINSIELFILMCFSLRFARF